jgi:alpha-tubulin suppressor-like RCC1 family protein
MRHLLRFVVFSAVILGVCGAWVWRGGLPAVTAQSRLSRSIMVAVGPAYSCAVLTDGTLRCFGQNFYGQLGLGNTDNYGDDPGEVATGLPAVDVGQTVKFVAIGANNTTCAIRTNNETVCWGYGGEYMLANGLQGNVGTVSGEMGNALTPIDFGTSYAVSLDIGNQHGCALLATGAIKCWGSNDSGQLGVNGTIFTAEQMGTNWPSVDLGSGRTALAMTTGDFHTCAILDTHAVACWGSNGLGQLGYGDTTNRGYADLGSSLTAVNLGTDRTATAIAAGGIFTCAILDNGSVKCWGLNNNGQLGQNSTTWLGDDANEMGDYLPAVYLGTGRTAKQIVANGATVCVILDNNTLKCWGTNANGQLGIGDTNQRGDTAGEMIALGTVNVGTGQVPEQIAVGQNHVCVLLTSTNLKCWGYGYFGQLGRGTTTDIGDGPGEMGDALTLLDFDGVTPTVTNTPAETDTPTATNTPSITKTPSKTYTRSKTPTRTKTKTKTRTPTKSKTPTRTPVGYVSRVQLIASGIRHTCALLANTTVKCWGYNASGELGIGDTTTRGDTVGEMGNGLATVNLGTGVYVKKMYAGGSHTCVLTTTNQIKCWGNNVYGQLGLGDTNNRGDAPGEMGDALPFVELGTSGSISQLSLGDGFSCALLDTGTVWCWGNNDWGQLGIGSTTNTANALVPVDLGTGRTAVSIAARSYGVCAILDDASIKCWGDNRAGQIGIGDTTERGINAGEMGDNLPTLPFAAYLTPIELAGGAYSTCARFDDGTVRCWGRGDNGALGTGESDNRGDTAGAVAALAAINLGSGHTVKRIFGSNYSEYCAILDDDTLKCWGNNEDANLGIGISSPNSGWGNEPGEMGDFLPTVDLGTGVTVTSVSTGAAFRCAILKTSTAVKCWGRNTDGQLGLESTYAGWGEYPDASMGDFLPYVRLGSIIPSTSTPTPTKSKTPTKTLSPSRTKSPTKTFTPSRTATRTPTP